MINDPHIAAALIGFVFGTFLGVSVAHIARHYSRLKKLKRKSLDERLDLLQLRVGAESRMIGARILPILEEAVSSIERNMP